VGPSLQLSCGFILLTANDTLPLEELIHQADQASYAAKHGGREPALA